jgi:teichoic acid transport system ATP-binding protein
MRSKVIEFIGVTKEYKIYNRPLDRLKESIHPFGAEYHRRFTALKDVTFTIDKGECVGIVGTNGSGKSTLLKLIAGVLTQSSGKIKINGRVSAILELGAGFNPELTGLENIYLNGTIMGYTRQEIDAKLESIIRFADIGEFLYQPVKTYSSGMYARLAFAVAINVEPEILIIDEALSVGDARFQIKCIEKMKEIRDAGTTILFVSHAIEQVKRFCTRAIWIERGVIRADGDANDIVNMYEDYLYSNINLVNEQQSSSVEQNVAATLLETRANGESDTQEPKGVPLTQEILQSEPRQVDMLGRILSVKCLTPHIRTFQSLVATVEYEIYDDVPNLLIGVAIYDRQRKYIFGPNTYLDNFKIPTAKGKYSITYTIPQLPLLSGTYFLDAGLFSEKGLVVLDYKTAAQEFIVRNDYFTEGLVYIQHEWRLGK